LPGLLTGCHVNVTSFVPQPDDRSRYFVFVTESAQAGRAEHEVPGVDRRLDAEPAGGQHANEMAASEEQHIAVHGTHAAYHATRPRSNLGRRFAPRAAVAKEHPIRAFGANLGSALPLVLAIIPFDQITIDLGASAEAGQFTSSGGPAERAGEHL